MQAAVNFMQTVCTYWLKNLCMKGDQCGFLHQFDPERMPVCRSMIKFGECKERDCPFKHTTDEIKECNMYKLGFCIYGPMCRYKHKKAAGANKGRGTARFSIIFCRRLHSASLRAGRHGHGALADLV